MVLISEPNTSHGVSRYFGNGHNGIDYKYPMNTPVYAAGDGVIDCEGDGKFDPWTTWMGGIYVRIKHGDMYTGYAHLSSTVINKGQAVKQGQLIGYSGSTGSSTGPHLHFEVIDIPQNWNNGYSARIDPRPFFRPAQPQQAKPQGGEMVTTKDQLNRLYEAVLRRPRGAGEGEDVYLGKDSGWVFEDLYKSAERAKRLQGEANEKASLVAQRDQATANSKTLQTELAKEKAKSIELEKKLATAPATSTDSNNELQALKDAAQTLLDGLGIK